MAENMRDKEGTLLVDGTGLSRIFVWGGGGGGVTVSCWVSRLGLIPKQLIFQQEYHDRTRDRDRREGGDEGYKFNAAVALLR